MLKNLKDVTLLVSSKPLYSLLVILIAKVHWLNHSLPCSRFPKRLITGEAIFMTMLTSQYPPSHFLPMPGWVLLFFLITHPARHFSFAYLLIPLVSTSPVTNTPRDLYILFYFYIIPVFRINPGMSYADKKYLYK